MAFAVVGPVTQPPGLPGGAYAGLDITAAQVIKAAPGICVTLSCQIAGTITLNDVTTTGGATTANQFFTGAMTAGQVLKLEWPCASGITVSAVSAGQFAIAFS